MTVSRATLNSIQWELGECVDRLEFNWGEFAINGQDDEGNFYEGNTQTFITQPEIDDVYDVKVINQDELQI